MTVFGKRLLQATVAAIALAAAATPPTWAVAQTSTTSETRAFNVPAGPINQAVLTLSNQAGVQVVMEAGSAGFVRSSAVRGRMTFDQALNQLLSGTGLTWRWLRPGVATIERVQTSSVNADGEIELGVVRVEGALGAGLRGATSVNGVNGSRDATATEGTGSYTSAGLTVASKSVQSIQDVPQSVSVVTAERLEDQRITDFNQAMAYTPGVTAIQGTNSLEQTFISRGFELKTVTMDGGSPLYIGQERGNFPLIDMAQYDHIEILRGAAGLFNGYGDPSGSINLVRKKPLDHRQIVAEAQIGSWETYRGTLDLSSPLAFDGRLRGRLVLAHQDNEYFYRMAETSKSTAYGIVEYDLTPTTLATVGVSYTKQDSLPWLSGLPRFLDGGDIGLPRNTSFALPWNRWDFETTQTFGSLEQQFGENWSAKLSLTRSEQTSVRKASSTSGAVVPETGYGHLLGGSYFDFSSDQLSGELVVEGSFDVLGQTQRIVFGANYLSADAGNRKDYEGLITSSNSRPYQPVPGGPIYCPRVTTCPAGARPPINVYNFDPNDPSYSEPPIPYALLDVFTDIQESLGSYVNVNLTAFDRLHLSTGVRFSRYKVYRNVASLCTPSQPLCAGYDIGESVNGAALTKYADTDITWPPQIAVSYDISPQLTAYLGYTDIFQSQISAYSGDLEPVEPVTGSNVELGLKWQSADHRLSATLSAYRIEQENFAIQDSDRFQLNDDGSIYFDDLGYFYFIANNGSRIRGGQISDSISCCYSTDYDIQKRSKGVDAEITGSPIDGWNVSASYSWNRNEYHGDDAGLYFGGILNADGSSTPLQSLAPEHSVKLWSRYDFSETGALGRLSIFGGLNWQSSAYYVGTRCLALGPTNALGNAPCLPNQTVAYSYVQPSYGVLALGASLDLSRHWQLSVNLENVTDTKYYQTAGSAFSGNWYGAPASATVTLRAVW